MYNYFGYFELLTPIYELGSNDADVLLIMGFNLKSSAAFLF